MYSTFLATIQDNFLKFGGPGQELMPVDTEDTPRLRPQITTADDLDARGQRLYTLAETQPAVDVHGYPDYAPAVYGPDLTTLSAQRLDCLERLYDMANAAYRRDQDALVSYILCECSVLSCESLKTHPEWK